MTEFSRKPSKETTNGLDRDNYRDYVLKWCEGVDNEAYFWSDFFRNKGGQWKVDYEYRTQAQPDFSESDEPWPLRVLDVGAGPISNVGIKTASGNIDLTACDAMAPVFNAILQQNSITPYVRTEFALLERLNEKYAVNSFDLVTMRNALDHCFDPAYGLLQMLALVKVGGKVKLINSEDEAEHENYNGFHQWNIHLDENGKLRIWRKNYSQHVDAIFGEAASITNRVEKYKDWAGKDRRLIHTIIVKHADVTIPPNPFAPIFDEIVLTELFRMVSSRYSRLSPSIIKPNLAPAEPA